MPHRRPWQTWTFQVAFTQRFAWFDSFNGQTLTLLLLLILILILILCGQTDRWRVYGRMLQTSFIRKQGLVHFSTFIPSKNKHNIGSQASSERVFSLATKLALRPDRLVGLLPSGRMQDVSNPSNGSCPSSTYFAKSASSVCPIHSEFYSI